MGREKSGNPSVIKLRVYIILFFEVFTLGFCQGQDYEARYRHPLDSPWWISGSFGALRNDHFHYGIDFATFNKTGFPIYASEEGYVSRIKISQTGYGKAVYIDHPDGFTTVYAHLSAIQPRLDSFIYGFQKNASWFEVDQLPKPGLFPVKRGEIIGWSGNSGSSSGPHLHYEVRDTRSEEIVHPFYFIPFESDSIKPEFGVKKVRNLQGREYVFHSDTAIVPAGRYIYFQEIYDQLANKGSAFVPHDAFLMVGPDTMGRCVFNRFHFDHSRRVNGHFDFNHWWKTGKRMTRFHQSFNNPVPIYPKHQKYGEFGLNSGDTLLLRCFAIDFQGNRSVDSSWLIGLPDTAEYQKSEMLKLAAIGFKGGRVKVNDWQMDSSTKSLHWLNQGTLLFEFPEGAVDSNQIISIKCYEAGGKLCLEFLMHDSTPFFKPVKMRYEPDSNSFYLLDSLDNYVFIQQWENKANLGGEWKNGGMEWFVKKPGMFRLERDLAPPMINGFRIPKNKKVKQKNIHWKIYDIESGIEWAGIYIDGQWSLGEYDAKSQTFFWTPREKMRYGKHDVMLVVRDKKGRTTEWAKQFILVP